MAIEVGCNRTVENNRVLDKCPIPAPVGCICKIVYRIDQAQKEAILEETTLNCSSPRLGDNVLDRNLFNTRPFSLYLPNGEKLAIDITDPTLTPPGIINSGLGNNRNQGLTSNLFRVESIEGCCACLRALVPNTNSNDCRRFGLEATCFCCTVDLEDFVCIQCFSDTYVSNLGSCID